MSEKNEKPLVFVGIPVYNGEKYIQRRIESILSQSYSEFEILISDNASNDSTSDICKKFEKFDRRITYFQQPKNLGYVKNFNYLIKNGRGKYFVLAAVDDLWEPDFLEKNVEVLENNNQFVGSIGEVEYFGITKKNKPSRFISSIKNMIRKQDVNILEKLGSCIGILVYIGSGIIVCLSPGLERPTWR